VICLPVPAVGDLLATAEFLELALSRLLNGVAALARKFLVFLHHEGMDE
jgi:hypothetical protein